MHIERNLASWERLLSVAVGTAFVVDAVRRRRGVSPMGFTGASLIARGVAGYCPISHATGLTSLRSDDTRVALSGARGTRLRGSVTIARPASEVFGFWKELDNLPLFVRGLTSVDHVDAKTTLWSMQGPGGKTLTWLAEVINEIEPELIAWRSLPGADFVSAGSVHFTSLGPCSTDVTVVMQYAPPGGMLGDAIGWILGRAPASDLRKDLDSLKSLLETGEPMGV